MEGWNLALEKDTGGGTLPPQDPPQRASGSHWLYPMTPEGLTPPPDPQLMDNSFVFAMGQWKIALFSLWANGK